MDINIYTDGSCLKNPDGPGGWGVVVTANGKIIQEYSEKSKKTTNNIMEMSALLKAMEVASQLKGRYKDKIGKIGIYSDSKYAIGCFGDWGFKWMVDGWTKKTGGEIKNLELVKKGVMVFQKNKTSFFIRWVKAHTGKTDQISLMNSRADDLARERADEAKAE